MDFSLFCWYTYRFDFFPLSICWRVLRLLCATIFNGNVFSPFTRTSGIFCVNLRLVPASNSICPPPCRSPRFSCARTPTWTNCASNWSRKCEWSRLESKNKKIPVKIDLNITLTFYLQLEWNCILAQLLLPHLADQAVVRAGPRISRWYFFSRSSNNVPFFFVYRYVTLTLRHLELTLWQYVVLILKGINFKMVKRSVSFFLVIQLNTIWYNECVTLTLSFVWVFSMYVLDFFLYLLLFFYSVCSFDRRGSRWRFSGVEPRPDGRFRGRRFWHSCRGALPRGIAYA